MVHIEDAARTLRMRAASDAHEGGGRAETLERVGRTSARARLLALASTLESPAVLAQAVLFVGILAAGIVARIHFSEFLDPFEDPYQNWWISANLLQTGQYWDRFSMMTHGNWLPLYHFFGAAVLLASGLRDFEALKLANIALSSATSVLVFHVGRRRSPFVGYAAMGFFSANFIDIVVSGWSTAEALATFCVFLGWAALFQFPGNPRRNQVIAAVALLLATMTRYEAWLVVALLAGYACLVRMPAPDRRRVLVACLPATVFVIGYFLYASQWGFLPSLVIAQTSTDLRYQVSVGTQRSPLQILATWWDGYIGFFPLVLALGGGYALWRMRRDIVPWIVLALWLTIILYTGLQLGNPSFRYVMVSVPFLSLYAAIALQKLVAKALPTRFPRFSSRRFAMPAVALAGAILVAATMVPPPATYWDSGFASSRYMEPLVAAGGFLATQPLPTGKILVTESPIAAYYSGYPVDRVLGSRYLPTNRSAALASLKENAAYIVYVGVPYYPLRTLFPELENGTSTPDFQLLFDAHGIEMGTHAVFVYEVRTQ